MKLSDVPRPPWYAALERELEPVQWLVIAILLAYAAVCVWMVFQPSRSLRTLWAVFSISP
jgi:tryptophan-rich sensory protein